jgi:hypothetical protein
MVILQLAVATFPFIEVFRHETGLPVQVVVWHVRSVRPIREAAVDEDTVTRIEFLNGDVLDVTESVSQVCAEIEGNFSSLPELAKRAILKLE